MQLFGIQFSWHEATGDHNLADVESYSTIASDIALYKFKYLTFQTNINWLVCIFLLCW